MYVRDHSDCGIFLGKGNASRLVGSIYDELGAFESAVDDIQCCVGDGGAFHPGCFLLHLWDDSGTAGAYGTIPLLQDWLRNGMSMGSAAAFMVTGPATKITNLGALKIVMGIKHFALYILFVMIFSLMTGLLVNMFV